MNFRNPVCSDVFSVPNQNPSLRSPEIPGWSRYYILRACPAPLLQFRHTNGCEITYNSSIQMQSGFLRGFFSNCANLEGPLLPGVTNIHKCHPNPRCYSEEMCHKGQRLSPRDVFLKRNTLFSATFLESSFDILFRGKLVVIL